MRIGPGFGLFGQLFGAIFAGLTFIVVAVVLIGLLVLVVRFLLSATRAADIYVRLHDVAKDAPLVDAPVADGPVADAPVADAPVADAPVATAPRTTRTKRIPKVPPTV
ncbi:MAG: hypothetical protein QOE85_265 [Actinomycetota bacterium]|nr:hypothetical protein [Actinomycetota bacterium]